MRLPNGMTRPGKFRGASRPRHALRVLCVLWCCASPAWAEEAETATETNTNTKATAPCAPAEVAELAAQPLEPLQLDLDFVRKRGTLRILFHQPSGSAYCGLSQREIRMLQEFAERHELRPRWFSVPDKEALLPALEAGTVDVIAGETQNGFFSAWTHTALLTQAWAQVRERLVERGVAQAEDNARTKDVASLRMRQVAARPESPRMAADAEPVATAYGNGTDPDLPDHEPRRGHAPHRHGQI